MNVLYHLTILPPPIPQAEALSQEIAALQRRFGGRTVYLNPNQRAPVYVPRLLFGFHKLRQLRTLEAGVHIHHIYNPDPFPFPILRMLRQPVVYSLTGGVVRRPNVSFFAKLAAVTVMDEASLTRLRGWGLENVCLARPGIDVGRFTHTPLPLDSEIRLMAGSAPWTRRQFRTKGIEALLKAAQREPCLLRLVFLWRGVLAEEMIKRVRAMGLQDQVTVLNRVVDVNEVLSQVHASVVLADAPDIVKAYPHSLMESLAAGKPALVSRAIPMAEYVERTGCGVVVESVTQEGILTAIANLRQQYDDLQRATRRVGQHNFGLDRVIASFEKVYRRVFEERGQLTDVKA
jgi:glycosyltransferase involved in cell wall biosynthesis